MSANQPIGLPANSPLTMAHLDQLNQQLQQVAIGKNQIALAEKAGIDVALKKQQLLDSEQRLLSIKQTYFPGM